MQEGQEHERRETGDRRDEDRRNQAIPVEVENREEDRRNDADRRDSTDSAMAESCD